MAKRRSTDDALAELAAMGDRDAGSAADAVLRDLICHPSAVVVARAAKVILTHQRRVLVPDVESAFLGLLPKSASADPGCIAKLALIEALNALVSWDAKPFLEGIRHVQFEPVYGGREDTASSLRGVCAFGLARLNHPNAHLLLASLAMEREVAARRAAVRALACLGDERSELVLRMKAMAGDGDSTVTAEALSALAQIAPEGSVEFIWPFLDDADPIVAEGAAIALGETRTAEAFEVLRKRWVDMPRQDERIGLLLPIALLRSEEAFQFLLHTLEEGHVRVAVAAAEALRLYMSDEGHRTRIEHVAGARGDRAILNVFSEEL